MPRQARQLSDTGLYHIIFRGIDRQNIFVDDYDRKKFIKEIIRTKQKYNYELYCYCLMNNHVHLIINDTKLLMSETMQSLAISYSSYFNLKYERAGHLFQNRFISKPIESESYLLNLQRYIHQNPQKAGICKCQYYKWSSYLEYAQEPNIIDEKFLLNIFGDTKEKAIENFKIFMQTESNKNDILDYEMKTRLTDEEATEWILNNLENIKIADIKKYNFQIRNKAIKKLKDKKVISNKQMSRILGINRKIIDRI